MGPFILIMLFLVLLIGGLGARYFAVFTIPAAAGHMALPGIGTGLIITVVIVWVLLK